jgi:putative hydrolase of the HAD superfamily
MSRTRAVVFDLGNVLIDVLWDRVLDAVAPRSPVPREDLYARVQALPALRAFGTGTLADPEAFCRALAEALELSLPPAEVAALWTGIFRRRPAMEQLFAEVRALVPVVILSDTDPLHWPQIRRQAPPLAAPDAAVLSYEVGALKPDPRMYAAAAAAAAVPAEACVFVDDRPANVQGARDAGMQAFRHVSAGTTRRRLAALLPGLAAEARAPLADPDIERG